MTKLTRALCAAVFFMLLTASAFAQLSTATVFGNITDTTGAAIPNAKVVLTQTQTNFTRTITTSADGSYREQFLPVGPYRLSVTAAGFKTLDRTGIVLSVMQNAELSLQLEVGGAGETVNVTADIPLVNLGDATLGRTVSNVEIDNLPLVNRDAFRLLQLVPGVQTVSTVNNLGFNELHVLVNGSTDSIVGQVSYYLDGGLNMTGLRNSGNAIPNPDALSQFNVATNNYSAQLGRYSAAVVSVITKGGTNKFHGSVFEFFRDRNFNANIHLQSVKNAYNQHRFGATLGGPIRHDKDFFFGSYGGFRYITSGNYSGSLPSAAQIAGNFSENTPTTAEQPNCTTAPTAAANTAVHFLVCNPATKTPYAKNTLPAVDPTAVNILNYLVKNLPPQQPVQFGDTVYTYRTKSPLPQSNNEYLIKTDHQIAQKHRVTLSFFLIDASQRVVPTTFTQAWSYSNYTNRQQNANVSETWTVTPRTINQFWLNYTRQYGGRVPVPGNSTLADFGSDFGVVGPPSRGQIAVGGVEGFTLGQSITGPKAGTNLYGVRDLVSTTKGKHTLYFGGEAGLEKDFQLTALNDYGIFTFTTTNGPSGARTTNALSDFLAGTPQTMNQDTGEYANANWYYYGLFAQDDFRLRPNLTINLGVRYDLQQAPTDTQDRQTNFVPGAQSHAFPNVSIIGKTGAQLAPLGYQFPGDPGVPNGGAFTPENHFSPRVGFAYDPYGNGKTVFHGAAGLFFGAVAGNEWEYPSNFAPYATRQQYSKVVSLTHPYTGDPTEFPGGVNPYPSLNFNRASGSASFLALNQVVAFDPNYRWPYSYQMNFGFQQQLGRNLSISASYVGTLNRKLPLYNDINGPQFNITAAGTSGASCTNTTLACGYANSSSTVNNRRPFNASTYNPAQSSATPIYSQVYIIRSNQNSNYNSLQVSVEQRITHHVSARGYYVWSKTLQSNSLDSSGATSGTFLDANYPQLEYRQRSDQDRRQMMTMSFVWKPDYFDHFNSAVRYALNGWTVTGIWTANSGQPFTVVTGNDNYFSGNGNNRPSIAPGKIAQVLDNGHSRVAMMNQWFDTSAYCIAGTGSCPGTGPLNLLGLERPAQLDDPGYRNVDASVFRDFKIHEELRFQIRGEVSNVFNLVNLGPPTATMNSVNFGKITGSGGDPRIIQVGGRVLF